VGGRSLYDEHLSPDPTPTPGFFQGFSGTRCLSQVKTDVCTEALPFNATMVQRDFFTAFHGSMRQGWTGTMEQLAEFLGT
jgi:hypothetical protein